ncbi:MAG: nitroreductase [Planctomycetota bacterium]|nr:MAG: nitroreductase [Planctomycetota bacterium]REJ90511.1 MAG: nitroreductase [Planctomycetota bacterium]REK24134.1 MAG: nitroreductase [Planctomycetota bacterium]REK38289.1 MAG: nitroreductase [Planctomycetota bacterium]
MLDNLNPTTIESIIRARRTEKVLCDPDAARPVPPDVAERNRNIVLQAIKTAGWAPFHYPRKVDGIAEPWRAHVLWYDAAHKAALHLRDELHVTSKGPRLAAACSALVLVTWLPECTDFQSQTEEKRARDEEHLAAAAAMVQNLLLLLTAHGMGTYWSSGGSFQTPEMYRYLGIPEAERLLAALFIEYPEMRDDSRERKPGSQRDNRCEDWIREVSL